MVMYREKTIYNNISGGAWDNVSNWNNPKIPNLETSRVNLTQNQNVNGIYKLKFLNLDAYNLTATSPDLTANGLILKSNTIYEPYIYSRGNTTLSCQISAESNIIMDVSAGNRLTVATQTLNLSGNYTILKRGQGTLKFGGQNSRYFGRFIVEEGNLEFPDSATGIVPGNYTSYGYNWIILKNNSTVTLRSPSSPFANIGRGLTVDRTGGKIYFDGSFFNGANAISGDGDVVLFTSGGSSRFTFSSDYPFFTGKILLGDGTANIPLAIRDTRSNGSAFTTPLVVNTTVGSALLYEYTLNTSSTISYTTTLSGGIILRKTSSLTPNFIRLLGIPSNWAANNSMNINGTISGSDIYDNQNGYLTFTNNRPIENRIFPPINYQSAGQFNINATITDGISSSKTSISYGDYDNSSPNSNITINSNNTYTGGSALSFGYEPGTQISNCRVIANSDYPFSNTTVNLSRSGGSQTPYGRNGIFFVGNRTVSNLIQSQSSSDTPNEHSIGTNGNTTLQLPILCKQGLQGSNSESMEIFTFPISSNAQLTINSIQRDPLFSGKITCVKQGTGTLNITGNGNNNTNDNFIIENGLVKIQTNTAFGSGGIYVSYPRDLSEVGMVSTSNLNIGNMRFNSTDGISGIGRISGLYLFNSYSQWADGAFGMNEVGTSIYTIVENVCADKIFFGGNFPTAREIRKNLFASDLAYNRDLQFYNTMTSGAADTASKGFKAAVRTISYDISGNVFVGGDFTQINENLTKNYFVSFRPDGTLFTGYENNLGSTRFNNVVYKILPDISSGKQLVGGQFTAFKGSVRNRLVRLNSDGTEDTSFYTNLGTAFSSNVWSLCLQQDGKIIVGGDFTTFNGNTRNRLVRLNSDGTEDTSFATNIGTGFNNSVRTISINSDGKIIVGGLFTTFNDNSRNRILRLNVDGTEDTSFYSNIGVGGISGTSSVGTVAVYTTKVQPDDKILVGGNYNIVNFNSKNYISRYNYDGTEDTSFYNNVNISGGFGGEIREILLRNNGEMIVGGAYNSYSSGLVTKNPIILNQTGTENTSAETRMFFGDTILVNYQGQYGGILTSGTLPIVNGVYKFAPSLSTAQHLMMDKILQTSNYGKAYRVKYGVLNEGNIFFNPIPGSSVANVNNQFFILEGPEPELRNPKLYVTNGYNLRNNVYVYDKGSVVSEGTIIGDVQFISGGNASLDVNISSTPLTASISGNLSMVSGTSYNVNTSGSATDLLMVTGNVVLNGQVNFPDTSLDVGTYPIIIWSGTSTIGSISVGTNMTGKSISLSTSSNTLSAIVT